MLPPKPVSRIAPSLALGLLAASTGAARAEAWAPAAEPSFQLLSHLASEQLPVELRAEGAPLSAAETLGVVEASGSHKVQLRWVVREHGELSGYRLTLVAAEGLAGHSAARWWVTPTAGTPLAGGLTSYSAELGLALDGETPLAAAIEAVDLSGHAVLLGVRRSVAAADPGPPTALSSGPAELSELPQPVSFSRAAPTPWGAPLAENLFSQPLANDLRLPAEPFASTPFDGGSISGRGPPAARLTTS